MLEILVSLRRGFDCFRYFVGKPGTTSAGFVELRARKARAPDDPLHLQRIVAGVVGGFMKYRGHSFAVGPGGLVLLVFTVVDIAELVAAQLLAEDRLEYG